MPKITMEGALRYFLAGLTSLVCLFFYDNGIDESIWNIKISFLALLSSVAVFAIYRPVLYPYFISPMLDLLNRKRKRNYRVWIKNRYGILNPRDQEALYAAKFRPMFPELNSKAIKERSALIHFTYQITFIFFVFGIISLVTRSIVYYLIFFVLSVGSFLAAILNDLQIDAFVFLTLDSAKAKCDKAAATLGYRPKQ